MGVVMFMWPILNFLTQSFGTDELKQFRLMEDK